MSTSTSPAVLYLGASRGVGFAAYTSLASTRKDIKSVLLLRSVSSFQNSPEYKSLAPDVVSRTVLVQGDAHSEESIRELIAKGQGNIEAIVSSIGQTPPSGVWNGLKALAKGFKMDPPDLCCRGLVVLLKTLAEVYKGSLAPKLVLVSSMGLGEAAHNTLPLGLKSLYSQMLRSAHEDKLAMEVALNHALLPSTSSTTSSPLPRFFPDPAELNPIILSSAQLAETIPSSFLHPDRVCVLRPALFSDGPAKGLGGKGGYRAAQEGDKSTSGSSGAIGGMYSIGRLDVGGFAAGLIDGRDENVTKWWGHQVVLAY